MMTIKPELLIPAGNLEKLRTAVLYGADAVYVGVAGLSLRARRSEFSMADLEIGVQEAHQSKIKVYAALNVFARNSDLGLAEETIQELNRLGIDGVIVSDPGVLRLVRRIDPRLPVHLSTQANTTNSEAVRFWKEQGVRRIVLARELSLSEVDAIARQISGIELELFIHGAMCMAYSGRCFLSAHWNRRSANQGDCTQPCRWDYLLVESSRPEQPLSLEEDDRYSYLLSSKDLCMLEYLPQILAAGVSALKVEGRMKSPYYVAAVTRTYRWALNNYLAEPLEFTVKQEWLDELRKVSYRGYTTGFYFSKEPIHEVNRETNYLQTHDLVGMVVDYDSTKSRILVEVRNWLTESDEIDVLLPAENLHLNPAQMTSETGMPLKAAHNGYRIYLPVTAVIPAGAVIRKKIRK